MRTGITFISEATKKKKFLLSHLGAVLLRFFHPASFTSLPRNSILELKKHRKKNPQWRFLITITSVCSSQEVALSFWYSKWALILKFTICLSIAMKKVWTFSSSSSTLDSIVNLAWLFSLACIVMFDGNSSLLTNFSNWQEQTYKFFEKWNFPKLQLILWSKKFLFPRKEERS